MEVTSMIKESKWLKLLMNTTDSVHTEVEDNVANLNNSWSDADVKSFLLGLFIFGKNFLNIKRFLENKGMGEILSFYYGKFYNYIIISLACVNAYYDAYAYYLELYYQWILIPFSSYFIVGIGKGKEDLTHPNVEHVKKTQNSEKLKNQGSLSSKNLVAFLFPGVKKFSRTKLVKGDHYFDSVNDVLSKVIAEPNLLKLEVVETKVGGSNGEDAETGSNKDGQPDNHHHHYLKHQASTNNGDHIMYAIFYIGLMHRGKPCNLSELKSLHGNSVGKVDVDDDDIAYNKGNMHISKTKHRKGKLDDISPSGTKIAKIYNKKNNISNPLSHQQDVTLISSSAEVSVELKKEGKNFNKVCLDKGISCDKVAKYESQHSINFNAPQVPLKFEDGEMMAMAEEDERKSTRNRPLTVRALEYFANELLLAQRKHKRKDTLTLKDPFSACSHKART
uniref:SANT domain-containing protein n=1 Tax=Glycine max TaxID=3847 RepID=A0A0R0I5U8_SOYBN